MYLISSLQALIQQAKTSPSLLSAHIRLLIGLAGADASVPAKAIRTARKYTSKAPASSQVWLARLEVEKAFGAGGTEGQASVGETWREARNSVAGGEEDVLKVWLWGLGDEEAKLVGDKKMIHEVSTSHYLIGESEY